MYGKDEKLLLKVCAVEYFLIIQIEEHCQYRQKKTSITSLHKAEEKPAILKASHDTLPLRVQF